jgi:hypothetical protein
MELTRADVVIERDKQTVKEPTFHFIGQTTAVLAFTFVFPSLKQSKFVSLINWSVFQFYC